MLNSTLSVLLRQMIDRVDRTGDVEGTEAFLQSEFRMYTTEHIARMDEILSSSDRSRRYCCSHHNNMTSLR